MRDYWSYCGEIADLDLMRFPDSGRFRGIAFITFATVRCSASSAALLMSSAGRKSLLQVEPSCHSCVQVQQFCFLSPSQCWSPCRAWITRHCLVRRRRAMRPRWRATARCWSRRGSRWSPARRPAQRPAPHPTRRLRSTRAPRPRRAAPHAAIALRRLALVDVQHRRPDGLPEAKCHARRCYVACILGAVTARRMLEHALAHIYLHSMFACCHRLECVMLCTPCCASWCALQ